MPNTPWLKNLVGASMTDEEMKDIPNPRAELLVHVTIKDVQAFGLLGSLVIGPVSAMFRKQNRSLAGVMRLSRKCGTVGAVLGLAAGPAMSLARMKSLEDQGVYDRCYSLRNNRNQVRVDRASFVGAAVGAGVGAGTALTVPYGAVLGMTAGVLGAAAFNQQHGDKHT